MSDPGRTLLLDRRRVAAEYGFERADVDRIFRTLEVVALPDSRKTYVLRADLDELIERHRYGDDRVRPV